MRRSAMWENKILAQVKLTQCKDIGMHWEVKSAGTRTADSNLLNKLKTIYSPHQASLGCHTILKLLRHNSNSSKHNYRDIKMAIRLKRRTWTITKIWNNNNNWQIQILIHLDLLLEHKGQLNNQHLIDQVQANHQSTKTQATGVASRLITMLINFRSQKYSKN